MTSPPAVALVINLDAARAIGFTVPPSIIARATQLLPYDGR